MMAVVHAWNRYWFRPAPLFNLAVARIIIVGTQIAIVFIADPRHEWVELAALPDSMYDPLPIFHLLVSPLGWLFRPSLEITEVIRWIVLATGLTSMIGLFTNFSLVGFAWANIFLKAYGYSFGDYHHPEGLMMIALVLIALSPAGHVLSVDDLRRRLRQSKTTGKFERYNLTQELSKFARWPLLSIRWLLVFAYSNAAFSKLSIGGVDWLNGYTLQYYLVQDAIRKNIPGALWLAQQHDLSMIMSWLSVFFEGTFFLVLIIPSLAWFYVPVGIGIHTGIYVAMRAPFFQWVALYAVFVSWTDASRRVTVKKNGDRRSQRLDIYFDGLCPLCIRSMTIIRYLDLFDRLQFCDLEQPAGRTFLREHPELSVDDLRREMHVVAPDGSVSRGFFAFRVIARYVPTLWPALPVFFLPFADRLGPRIYRQVAAGRVRRDNCESGTCARHVE